MIITPPKLFLDTNHLVNIANINQASSLGSSEKYREDYLFIRNCIRDGLCALIFNPYAPLEWVEGDATKESALQIAQVFDQAKCLYQLEEDTIIYASEILKQCKEINPQINFPDLPVLHYLKPNGFYTPAMSIIAKNAPDYNFGKMNRTTFPDNVPVVSINTHVTEAFQWVERNANLCQERIDGFKTAYEMTKKQAGEMFTNFSNDILVSWMKGFLQIDKILKTSKCKIEIDKLLSHIDVTKCPAVNLCIKIWEHLIQNNLDVEDNDCDDLVYLPAVLYADISLIERNLKDRMMQADQQLKIKVLNNPSYLTNFLRNTMEKSN